MQKVTVSPDQSTQSAVMKTPENSIKIVERLKVAYPQIKEYSLSGRNRLIAKETTVPITPPIVCSANTYKSPVYYDKINSDHIHAVNALFSIQQPCIELIKLTGLY